MFTKSGTLICRNEFRRGLFGNASRHTTHISEKCGIAESLKCNIKTACDLHLRVLAETRNYREITILGIRYLRWHTGELSSPFPVTPFSSHRRGVSCFPKLQQEWESQTTSISVAGELRERFRRPN